MTKQELLEAFKKLKVDQKNTYCASCLLCAECVSCARCTSCTDCLLCANCVRCTNCVGCTNCLLCTGLEGESLHVLNKPVSREEYERVLGVLKGE